jgi:hypothetical protein
VLIAEGGFRQNHLSAKKFIQCWRRHFIAVTYHANSTYTVCKLNGLIHRVSYPGKRVKLFKRRIKFGELEDVVFEEELEGGHQHDDLEEAKI